MDNLLARLRPTLALTLQRKILCSLIHIQRSIIPLPCPKSSAILTPPVHPDRETPFEALPRRTSLGTHETRSTTGRTWAHLLVACKIWEMILTSVQLDGEDPLTSKGVHHPMTLFQDATLVLARWQTAPSRLAGPLSVLLPRRRQQQRHPQRHPISPISAQLSGARIRGSSLRTAFRLVCLQRQRPRLVRRWFPCSKVSSRLPSAVRGLPHGTFPPRKSGRFGHRRALGRCGCHSSM